jgi:porphobilinogen synthase
MIDAAAKLGRLDRDAIMLEALACLKRAGADLTITYFAKRAAELLLRQTERFRAALAKPAPSGTK